MLDQHALELERADPVVRRFEHIVGAADEREVAVAVARRDVAGVVVAISHRIRRLRVVIRVAVGQAERPFSRRRQISPSVADTLPSGSSSTTS